MADVKEIAAQKPWEKMNLKFELIPIEKITPYDKNTRKHTEVDVATTRASIEKFGMDDPIGVWGKKNLIVEGHGRLLALKAMGWKGPVPCVRLDHLSDAQRRAYAIAHNRTAEMSEWDFDALDEERADLEENFGIDFTDIGFPEVEDEPQGEMGDGESFVNDFGGEQVLQDKELEKSTVAFEVPREKLPLIRGYRSKFGDGVIVDFILKTVDEAMLGEKPAQGPAEGEKE